MTHNSSTGEHNTAAHLSDETRHFFHVVSNIRPIVWIGLYVALMPVFAVIYWIMPDGQFRIPDGAGTDFGSWLYYSIVTITTLGFGDYTPAHGWAQAVTAVEVMCGLVILGFFLNAVGSMKSEIDVSAEVEKQRRLREEEQKQLLKRNAPGIIHILNIFLGYCYAVTTPTTDRGTKSTQYNPDFSMADMKDMFAASGLPFDYTGKPAVQGLLKSAERTSLALDSLQTKVDLTQWPGLLEDAFRFVANCQLFDSAEAFGAAGSIDLKSDMDASKPGPVNELYHFIKENAALARDIEVILSGL